MTKSMVRRVGLLFPALAIGVGLTGCSSTVSASDIAQQAKTKLNQALAAQGKSGRIASVSCPKDLPVRVGASEVCSGVGTPGQVAVNITAKITAVNGSTAHFDYSLSTASSAPTGTTTS